MLILSCSTDTLRVSEECPKPYQIPKWIEWDCDKDRAYKDGRYYFNEDSTVFAIGTGDKMTKEESNKFKQNIKDGKVEIKNDKP
jgi:hypothetical protein